MGVIGVVTIMIGIVPATRPALIVGAIWVVAVVACYALFIRGRSRTPIQLMDETSPITTIPAADAGALEQEPSR